jgi:hypothetical protein
MLESVVDDLMPQGRVRIVLLVRPDVDEWKLATDVISERHAVVSASAKRLHERVVVRMAVRHHHVDRRRVLNAIERPLDPLVEDRVRTHLDPVDRHFFSTSRTPRPNASRFGTVISSYSRDATTPFAPAS